MSGNKVKKNKNVVQNDKYWVISKSKVYVNNYLEYIPPPKSFVNTSPLNSTNNHK